MAKRARDALNCTVLYINVGYLSYVNLLESDKSRLGALNYRFLFVYLSPSKVNTLDA